MSGDASVLASAATSASYNMLLQLLFRMLTFVLNAFILRYISRDMLGIVNVRLTLLYSTTLFVAREAFRRACMSKSTERRWPQVINLLWCVFPIGIVCSSVFGYIWLYILEQPDPGVVPNYRVGVVCFAVSTVIELLAEPLWVVGQILLFVRLRVLIEGSALALRCILTVLLILYWPHWGVVAFSIAQIVFTMVYTLLYYGYFIHHVLSRKPGHDFPFQSVRDFFPRLVSDKPLISWGLAGLTWSFFKQSFLKQILTEGERYVMTVFDVLNFGDQGIYDVINNLGSLAARFLFLPIEDSGYLFFSQTLTRGSIATQQPKDSLSLATAVLESLLKIVSLLGLTILVFGYGYSYLLLDLYGGSLLSSGTGPMLLKWYCVYVLLIAINGTTECFVFATMSQAEVDRYNHKMLLFSVLFLLSSWYFTTLVGSVGFILANCLNMLARIIHSIYYTHHFYQDSPSQPLRGVLPSPSVLMTYILAFVITTFSERTFCCDRGLLFKLLHIGIGGLCLLCVLAAIYRTEKKLIRFVLEQYRERTKRPKKE